MATKIVKKSAPTKVAAPKKVVAVKGTAPKSAAKKAEKPAPVKSITLPTSLKISLVDTSGNAAGTMTLPEEVFGAKVNKQLIAQAVRAYRVNQRAGSASTKGRGEVEGSTRKIYRQKGTGRARHGGIRAPIFVGGGVSFGPTPTDFHMAFPVKMRRMALASALTWQFQNGHVIVMDGLSSLEAKTKLIAQAIIAGQSVPQTLLIVNKDATSVLKAARNIGNVDVMIAEQLNTYAVATHNTVVFMKEAVNTVKDVLTK